AGVFKEAIEPLFHSSKATVVAEDTFIEPQKDLMTSGTKGLAQDLTYGRVEPRPLGLRSQLGKDKVVPLALKQKAETAVPEAANAAWVDAIVAEAQIQQVAPNEIHPLPDVLEGTTYTREGAICLPEELDMPFTEKQALALQQTDDFPHPSKSQSQDDLSSGNHHQ
ncbi:unnamed protein product, partial [Symbiodinium pilosum]